MRKKRFSVWTLLLSVLLSVALTLGAAFGGLWRFLGPTGLGMAEAMVLINTRFVGEDYDMTEATDGAMNALITGLGDRWSYYLDATSYQRQKESKDNAYEGIGATISYPAGEDGLHVVSVVEGGPADLAGIRAGDTILSVDGTTLTSENRVQSVELTHGPAGTTTSLEVRTANGVVKAVEVIRGRVEEHPVSSVLLKQGTGLITLKNFNSRCAQEAQAAVEELIEQGAQRLVFDVRNNGGGYLGELTKLLDYLLPEGVIFRSETRTGRADQVESDASCVELPIAVLLNENTYSAAELFAAQIREMERGIVVGTPSTGKGFSQQTFPLFYGGAINISTAKYFTGNGVSLIGTGLVPDHPVPLTEEQGLALLAGDLKPEDDPQIQRAILELRDQ